MGLRIELNEANTENMRRISDMINVSANALVNYGVNAIAKELEEYFKKNVPKELKEAFRQALINTQKKT